MDIEKLKRELGQGPMAKMSHKERVEAWERQVNEQLRQAFGAVVEEKEQSKKEHLKEGDSDNPLSVYSTGQLKAELRKRKRWA